MSVLQLPNLVSVLCLETGEAKASLGAFRVASHFELDHIQLTMLKFGPVAGTPSFRLRLYPTADLVAPIWVPFGFRALSELADPMPDYWTGLVRFDMGGFPLNKNLTYYLAVETSGYTASSSAYVGFRLDTPDTVNTQSDGSRPGAQLRLFGRALERTDDPEEISA